MTRVRITPADDLDGLYKGQRWRPVSDLGPGEHLYGDGRPMHVVVSCPEGHLLGLPHTVADDGAVHPSIVCTDCGWHVWGQLDGWEVSS